MPTITVAPAGGDFDNITDALASILDASPSNVYTIQVEPGTYPEAGRYGLGLMLKDYVNIEGTDRDTVIIQSDGGGADHDAIWAIARCTVKDCTIQAQTTDHYAVHIDKLCDYFTMENVVITHDNAAKPAIGAGARAGQIITLQDVTITQGTFSIHSDVFSRAVTPDPWQWKLINVAADTLTLIDFVEYKLNRIELTGCTIGTIEWSQDLTYYNLYPTDPLFNQGFTQYGMYLYDGHGNTITTLDGITWTPAQNARSGLKLVSSAGTAERLHVDLLVNSGVMVQALQGNTGLIYLGNDGAGNGAGDVSSASGLPLSAGDTVLFVFVGNLRELYIDAAIDGEGAAWQII